MSIVRSLQHLRRPVIITTVRAYAQLKQSFNSMFAIARSPDAKNKCGPVVHVGQGIGCVPNISFSIYNPQNTGLRALCPDRAVLYPQIAEPYTAPQYCAILTSLPSPCLAVFQAVQGQLYLVGTYILKPINFLCVNRQINCVLIFIFQVALLISIPPHCYGVSVSGLTFSRYPQNRLPARFCTATLISPLFFAWCSTSNAFTTTSLFSLQL